MAYSEKVKDNYERPRNIGNLDGVNKSVSTGLVDDPE